MILKLTTVVSSCCDEWWVSFCLLSFTAHLKCTIAHQHGSSSWLQGLRENERRRRQRVAKDKITKEEWYLQRQLWIRNVRKLSWEPAECEKSETWNWCQRSSERMKESQSSREWTHVSVCGTLVGSQLSRHEMVLRVVTQAGQPKMYLRPD